MLTSRAYYRTRSSRRTPRWGSAVVTWHRWSKAAGSRCSTTNRCDKISGAPALLALFFVTLEKPSPCKVNLLLNILGKRADGFHELETVMQPVNLCDELTFERGGSGIQLTCSDKNLPIDSGNLVFRAAKAFLDLHLLHAGVRIHLEKRIPLAAGLGGGSGNAAVTLLGMNEIFGSPLPIEAL